jgi:hypothetical protein
MMEIVAEPFLQSPRARFRAPLLAGFGLPLHRERDLWVQAFLDDVNHASLQYLWTEVGQLSCFL